MCAPVSGKVVAVNTDLSAHPERLCDDPHGTWIIKLEVTKPTEITTLLSNEQYAKVVASPPKPKPPPKKPPRNVKPQPTPQPPPPSPAIERDKLAALSWSIRLGDTRLRGGDEAFGDRDYSGGSYFSWREREIVLAQDHRFVWEDRRFSRISTAGLSSTIPSNERYEGTWKITVVGGSPRLVFEDSDRGVTTFRLEASTRGHLLLDSKLYSWSRL